MKLLIVASFAPSLINFRGNLIRQLISMGHEVVVTAPDITTNLAVGLEALGVRSVDIPLQRNGLNPVADLRYVLALKRLIQHEQIEMVLSYTIKPNIWGAFAAADRKVPSAAMVTGLGYAFTSKASSGLRAKGVRLISRWLYRQATDRNAVVIFQNADDIADFIAAGSLRHPNKARLVNGSGVDTNFFAPTVLPEKPIFLMIARLLKSKGVAEYACAAQRILREFPHAEFRIAGPFDEGSDSIAPADLDNWVENGLNYLGTLDDVRPALSEASVYVLPSYREGTPRSVLEAMAMGRPILTTDVPGCRETVIVGKNGFLVPAGDSFALEEKMRWFISHHEKMSAMGLASRAMVCEKFEVHRVSAQTIAHLNLPPVCQ